MLRRKKARIIPFGWKDSEEHEGFLEEIPEQQQAMQQAQDFLRGSSYREVAEWLSAETGRRITHAGLRHLFKLEDL